MQALGYSVGIGEVLLVNISVALLAGLLPIPGGIGVSEGGLTLGLVQLGVPEESAFAAVILYRLATFYVPPVWGFFAMRWLERNKHLERAVSPGQPREATDQRSIRRPRQHGGMDASLLTGDETSEHKTAMLTGGRYLAVRPTAARLPNGRGHSCSWSASTRSSVVQPNERLMAPGRPARCRRRGHRGPAATAPRLRLPDDHRVAGAS